MDHAESNARINNGWAIAFAVAFLTLVGGLVKGCELENAKTNRPFELGYTQRMLPNGQVVWVVPDSLGGK